MIRKQGLMAGLFAVLLVLSGCVTETSGGPFRNPTQDDLQTAMSLYVQIAYQQMEAKQYDRAMASVGKALEVDEDSPMANTALAVAYQYQGEKHKAEKTFKRIISRNSSYPDVYLRYGNFLFLEKRYEEACENLQHATEYDFYDKRPAAFYNLGTCLREVGKLDEAEHAFDRCLGLQPDNYVVLIELADMKYQRKAYPEAKKLFDKYAKATREGNKPLTARALWLGIRLERIFDNSNGEASLAMMLKNTYPYSAEYLEYKKSLEN